MEKVEAFTEESGAAESGTAIPQPAKTIEVSHSTGVVIGDHAQVIINPPKPPEQPYRLVPHVPAQKVKGRSDALASLIRLLKPGDPSDCKEVALWGVGGIGKTTLVQYLAHSPTCAEIFPDGHLWVELGRDYDPANLAAALRELAVGMRVEAQEGWNAEQYKQAMQNQLAGKKVLLVIDDVWKAIHVDWSKHICGKGCGILYTTRKRDVAVTLVGERSSVELEVLESKAALDLLADQVDITQIPKPKLIQLCQIVGYLPLGLKLAGCYLANNNLDNIPGQPPWALEYLIEQRQARLDLLLEEMKKGVDRQDGATIRDILHLSLKDYSDQEQQNFARLSIFASHPPIWTKSALYHIWDCVSEDDYRKKMQKLVNDGLVERRQGDDRLTMHSLVADYAEELFDQSFPAGSEARKRIEESYADYYLQYAKVKENEPSDDFYNRLDHEFANLSKAVPWLIQSSKGEAIEMVLGLRYYLEVRGYWKESRAWLQMVLDMVEGNPAVQITSQQSTNLRLALSMACFKSGDFGEAETRLKEMLTEELSIGDPFLLARLHYNLGMTLANQKKFAEPVEHLQQSWAAAERMVNPNQKQRMLLMIYQQLGNSYLNGGTPSTYRQAKKYLIRYLRLARDWKFADNRLLGYTYMYLGQAEYCLSHEENAYQLYHKALGLAREVKDIENQALSLLCLAEVSLDLEGTPAAVPYLTEGEEICQKFHISYLLDFIEDLKQKM